MDKGDLPNEKLVEEDSNFRFYCQLKDLMEEHYVPKAVFYKLQSDYNALREEYERSRTVFKKKLEEWQKIKEYLKGRGQAGISTNPRQERRHLEKDQTEECNEKIGIMVPRSNNKAARRIAFGGNTPPGYWSTKFTPDK